MSEKRTAEVHGLAVAEETGVVTQKELAAFKAMAETSKTYASKVKTERAKLMKRLETGEKVEQGRYDFKEKKESGSRSWSSILPKFLKRVVLKDTGKPFTYKELLAETKPENVTRWRIVDTENGDAVV